MKAPIVGDLRMPKNTVTASLKFLASSLLGRSGNLLLACVCGVDQKQFADGSTALIAYELAFDQPS